MNQSIDQSINDRLTDQPSILHRPPLQGFLFSDLATAKTYFEKAKVYFQKALDLEPSNEIYQKSLEVTAKAPLIHKEMQEQLKVGVVGWLID